MSDDGGGGGGDCGGGDSGACSNDYSNDRATSSNDYFSSAHTDNHRHHSSSGHTGNDYAGIGSTVFAFNSAMAAVSSMESATSAFHHRDSSHSTNRHSSTRLQIDDAPSHDKYTAEASESIWKNYPTDNIPSGGNRRDYRSYIRNDSSLNVRENYNPPPIPSTGCGWSALSKPKKVIIIVASVIILIAYLYVLFDYVIAGYTTKYVSKKH